MSTLKIYGIPQSRMFRTLWMVTELGIPYEHVAVAQRTPAARTSEYLALNPNAKVPTIADGDFVLWESMAINLYLAKKHSLGKLYPATLEGEALAWQWSLWSMAHLEAISQAWAAQHYVPAEKRNEAAEAEAFSALNALFTVLEGKLADQPYLLGNDFTVADLNPAAVLTRISREKFPKTPRMSDWLARCYERPAAIKAREMREKAA